MNEARALEKVAEVVSWLDRSRAIYDGDHEHYYRHPDWERMNELLLERLPLIRKIAAAAHPTVENRFIEVNQMYVWPWDGCYDACLELRGALSSAAETTEILGKAGPQLAAESLHPWVWHAAVDLWSDGHRRQAVLDAYNKVEQMTQYKTGRLDVSGKALWGEVFNKESPQPGRSRLRFPEVPADSERFIGAHEGALHFGMGCAQGIRNWAAHTSDAADEQQALEYLAALSVLARWVQVCDPMEA